MAKDHAKIDAHVTQWKHNRSLIDKIPASHPDWVVTVAFYTAVHAIDTALAFEECRCAITTLDSMPLLGSTGCLRSATSTIPLYDLSRKVRYTADPNQWIPPEDLERQVIRRYLLPLEQSVEKLIGKTLSLPPIQLLPRKG